jgi:glycerate kinase
LPKAIVVAQAFKETLSPSEVAAAVAAGAREAGVEPEVMIASDGGDGLLAALEPRSTGRTRHRVTGPLGEPVEVEALWLGGDTGLIESRLVCGLSLVPEGKRNPRYTTTRGVGELAIQLAELGARRVIVGLGGSATMDGGMGMARAFGWVPRGRSGAVLPDCGGALAELEELEPGTAPPVSVVGLADVSNPLLGSEGAAVYARQKGASPQDQARLMLGLERLVRVLGARELAERPGAGAAGGLGFGVMFFAGGEVVSGAGWVLDLLGFDRKLEGASLAVVGEGAFDRTSLWGKLTGEVIRRAQRAGVPVVVLAPRAECVPEGVVVESGGGIWDSERLSRRAAAGIVRALRGG